MCVWYVCMYDMVCMYLCLFLCVESSFVFCVICVDNVNLCFLLRVYAM